MQIGLECLACYWGKNIKKEQAGGAGVYMLLLLVALCLCCCYFSFFYVKVICTENDVDAVGCAYFMLYVNSCVSTTGTAVFWRFVPQEPRSKWSSWKNDFISLYFWRVALCDTSGAFGPGIAVFLVGKQLLIKITLPSRFTT